MRKVYKAFVIVVVALFISVGISCFAPKQIVNDVVEPCVPPLSFDENGDFTILHLTDFHEWLGIELPVWGVEEQESLKLHLLSFINESVALYQPDLVVLGGDNIFGLSAFYDLFAGLSIKTYKEIANTFEELGVYWTLTFGNHDSEGVKTKYAFLNAISSYSYFIGGVESGKWHETHVTKAENGESDYVSNFKIPVYNHSSQNVGYNLFILDSGSYDYVNKVDGYRAITGTQTAWYESKIESDVPSVMFAHIPFPECETAYLQNGGVGTWAPISPSYVPTNILDAIMEHKNTRGVFFGHNHLNGWTGFYNANNHRVMLGITPMAQAHSYDDAHSLMSGRIVKLNSNGNFSTFVFDSIDMQPDENAHLIYNV